jgi:hypothetical protein
VGSAVAIVFVNKVLMSRQNGYAFSFGEHTATAETRSCQVMVSA